jgi:hypothetical protein
LVVVLEGGLGEEDFEVGGEGEVEFEAGSGFDYF